MKEYKIEKIIAGCKTIKILNKNIIKFGSEAKLVIWENKLFVLRTIGKQYNLTSKSAKTLSEKINKYYLLLKKNGVFKVPQIFSTFIDKRNTVVILMTEYFPENERVNKLPVKKKLASIEKIANHLIKFAMLDNKKSSHSIKCSVDTNLDNFFLSRNKIIYNDFSPPLFCEDTGFWHEFRRKDELHESRTEKKKRYFNRANLFLNFINKTRIHLSFRDYNKFVLNFLYTLMNIKEKNTDATLLINIITKIIQNPSIENCRKFRNKVGTRDLLRFALSLNRNFSTDQMKLIYKKSKEPGGIKYLENQFIL